MPLLYCDPRFLHHETGVFHPERADRIRDIPERLDQAGLTEKCVRPEWERASRPRLGRVHAPSYVHEIWATAKSGGGEIDSDTVVGPGSYDVARLAAGAVCDATERIVRGEAKRALCLVRPPGHHAVVNHGMGFCLFNNVAVASRVAIAELGVDRVLIVDWDVHHGNGTQATFWDDPRVGFLSVHRWPFYPGTGWEDETGTGPGLGYTLNVPLPLGITRQEYLSAFSQAVEEFADKVKPQLVFISAGFDTHRLDPIGNLGLETEDFIPLTNLVLDVADTHAGGRLISVLEGGYHPPAVCDSVELHLAEIVKRETG